ncbi:hypothetical protein BKP45_06975 [Anaerobacillus alkalidiazotrophicus]|uniref:6-hydroxymethylpterin diphosphokinase MptE-like domain-containing protein n=1 Tax=Anaerobacillus alkalidiazotrophicus TaxID=472963 RepID=A0A1S2MCA9_9BACI|nr:6-hydroxymethylpterin diphosphokinase MptE-like protein [Anaerobacillus alkalidiazotrophicus]OIJ22371.1 hypothetical protein BKP45_06975 [Anaerobacillus alkalidiazotrophicus]
MKWELIETSTSDYSIKLIMDNSDELYLNSRYNPLKEAKRWVEGIKLTSLPKKFIIVGMGAGYHIRELHLRYPNIEIEVWDFNNDFANWIKSSKTLELIGIDLEFIKYHSTENKGEINKEFIPFINDDGIQFLIYKPALNLIPPNLSLVKEALNDLILLKQNSLAREELLSRNIKSNLSLEDKGVVGWINQFSDQPIILVSAGPSLTKQLPLLQELSQKNNIQIACVGTALIPLTKFGIKPNLVMISDPTIKIKEQFIGVNTLDIPLFYLSTANYEAVNQYKGDRYIVWQKDYLEAERQAEIRNEPTIRTGGSVATCLLDLLVKMGSNPIALVGQDLAFTNGISHAKGTHNCKPIFNVSNKVPNFNQTDLINTSASLNSFRKWFERYVAITGNENQFWNCTEGGAYIKGWKHCSLLEFIEFVTANKAKQLKFFNKEV